MNSFKSVMPTPPSERIYSLDVLRGVAILGILIMNIQSFAMIEAAYINPTAFGDFTGLNKWVWILSHLFADQKFLSLFSILFGAGVILITQRAKIKGYKSTSLYYRRTIWLLIIGLIHAYLFWHGDILVTYALCGFIVYAFRNLKPNTLVIVGLIVFSISSLLYLFFGWSMQFWPPEAFDGTMQSWLPNQEIIDKEIAALQGTWLQQMAHRVPSSLKFQTFIFLIFTGWRAGGLMLIGMALYKWRILSAERSGKFYRIMTIAGLTTGFVLILIGIKNNFAYNFDFKYSMFIGWQFNYWGSLFVAMGYIGIAMYFLKRGKNIVLNWFAAIGRTALSNYLLQTIICTLIYYGHGLGYFGQVDRVSQILIVFGVWIFQIVVTNIWIRYFQFGPVEWLWRSLSYLKVQPLKNAESV